MGARDKASIWGGSTSSQAPKAGPNKARGSRVLTSRVCPFPLLAIPGRGSLHHVPELPGLASAGPDHLICSTAEGTQQGRLALSLHVPCTSSGRKAPMEPPWCPAQKLWATSLTMRGLRAPRHHTRLHTVTRYTQPLRRAHADMPTDLHSHCPHSLLVVWVYRPCVCPVFPNVAKCSPWLPRWGRWYYRLFICCLISSYFLNMLQ